MTFLLAEEYVQYSLDIFSLLNAKSTNKLVEILALVFHSIVDM